MKLEFRGKDLWNTFDINIDYHLHVQINNKQTWFLQIKEVKLNKWTWRNHIMWEKQLENHKKTLKRINFPFEWGSNPTNFVTLEN